MRWSDSEVAYLRENYGPMNAREIAVTLGKTRQSVHAMRKRSGLKMTVSQKSRACSSQHAIQAGEANNNWKGGISLNRYIYTKKYRRSNPELAIAHATVCRAIKRGTLVRSPCEMCGCVNVQAHHDDYSKPLSVRWLCKKHHIEADNDRRRKESASVSE